MTSEKFLNKITIEDFKNRSYYLGIAIQPVDADIFREYIDIDYFFLSATYNLTNSRMAEGFFCWLLKFGHALSPSKIRRLISDNNFFDSAVLGGFIEFLIINNIMSLQWKIILPFCKKRKIIESMFSGPHIRQPAPYLLKYGVLVPNFKLDTEKFLKPTAVIYKNCIELRNRVLFGSVVHADAFSYITKYPGSSAYEIAKNTHHHKARVFQIYDDMLAAG